MSEETEKLKAEVKEWSNLTYSLYPLAFKMKEWSDLAYELYALACNSTTNGTDKPEDWTATFERLRDRFHTALEEERAREDQSFIE